MKELPYFFTCKPSDFFQYWTQKFKRFFQEKGGSAYSRGFGIKKPKSNCKRNDSFFFFCVYFNSLGFVFSEPFPNVFREVRSLKWPVSIKNFTFCLPPMVFGQHKSVEGLTLKPRKIISMENNIYIKRIIIYWGWECSFISNSKIP